MNVDRKNGLERIIFEDGGSICLLYRKVETRNMFVLAYIFLRRVSLTLFLAQIPQLIHATLKL